MCLKCVNYMFFTCTMYHVLVFYIADQTLAFISSYLIISLVFFIYNRIIFNQWIHFWSKQISKWPAKNNTYGWVRMEILGALVNAVFLVALCFSILVEALKRVVTVEEVENPVLLLIVGGAGLAVNLIGLVLFGGQTWEALRGMQFMLLLRSIYIFCHQNIFCMPSFPHIITCHQLTSSLIDDIPTTIIK